MARSDDEWNRRTLCSDGNCIGVIGADGRCKECGRPYEGELPPPADTDGASDEEVDEAAEGSVTPAKDAAGDDPPVDGQSGDDDWDRRTLCRDESCIGVIGADGRCSECGRPYSE